MKLLKEALAVLGALILLAVMAVIVMPKATHAVVAALVRDEDQPARHPFYTSCTVSTATATGVSPFTASCSTPAIPAGEEVVIETVSFSVPSGTANPSLWPSLSTTTAGAATTFDLGEVQDAHSNLRADPGFLTTQAIRLYADPGSVIGCSGLVLSLAPGTEMTLTCTLSGYWVSLP